MKLFLFLVATGVGLVVLAGVVVIGGLYCINAFANFVGGGGVDTDNSP